ncbi:nucleoside hydrolase [Exilibacterium tricleocarpae]|nr:nucleoside hydrolase [Exilibacterium tricleocarpae]
MSPASVNVHIYLAFFLLSTTVLFSTAARGAQPVIYDTDMAIDDWSALIFLAKHPAVDLRAVTISASGETHCKEGIQNVLSLLDLGGAPETVAVSCGDEYPLDGYFVFPLPWQEQADTLSGVAVPKSKRRPRGEHAVETIHRVLAAAKEPVTLIPVGPLTNIAQWLERYPEDRAKVGRVVIMGGAFDTKGNIIVPGFTGDHPNTSAEWNIFIDPLAADKVLRSGLNIELVGLDVTNHVRVTSDYVEAFSARVNNPAADFFNRVFIENREFIASNEYYFWDVLATLITVKPDLCGPEVTPVTVSYVPTDKPAHLKTSDLSMPKTRWDGKSRQHLDAGRSGITRRAKTGPPIKVCMRTDRNTALQLFTDIVTAPASP